VFRELKRVQTYSHDLKMKAKDNQERFLFETPMKNLESLKRKDCSVVSLIKFMDEDNIEYSALDSSKEIENSIHSNAVEEY
jgi:hypothetical protein